jgi:hypothetical protein
MEYRHGDLSEPGSGRAWCRVVVRAVSSALAPTLLGVLGTTLWREDSCSDISSAFSHHMKCIVYSYQDMSLVAFADPLPQSAHCLWVILVCDLLD